MAAHKRIIYPIVPRHSVCAGKAGRDRL